MLILTRRVGETVMIGEDVTVTVLGVKGNQVRIGVNAPRATWEFRQLGKENVETMRAAGVHAFLVGEAFMRAEEPGEALRALFD